MKRHKCDIIENGELMKYRCAGRLSSKGKCRMEKQEGSAIRNIRRRNNFKYALVIEGVFIGLITGALISVFRLMLTMTLVVKSRLIQ